MSVQLITMFSSNLSTPASVGGNVVHRRPILIAMSFTHPSTTAPVGSRVGYRCQKNEYEFPTLDLSLC